MITEATARLERYEAQLPRVVAGWRWEPVVRALMSLRGVARLGAATLVAELGDLHRFEHPAKLMGYLGLVPSEDSTGEERHQGGSPKWAMDTRGGPWWRRPGITENRRGSVRTCKSARKACPKR